jgi:hypothetical protein
MGGDEYFLAANLGIHKYVIDIPLGLAFITGFILCLRALANWRIILKWLGAIILGLWIWWRQANRKRLPLTPPA